MHADLIILLIYKHDIKPIDTFIRDNEKLKDIFNNLIDERIIQHLEDMRLEINNSYEANRQINLHLKPSCELIKQTAMVISRYSNHILNQSISSIVIQKVNIELTSTEFETHYAIITETYMC